MNQFRREIFSEGELPAQVHFDSKVALDVFDDKGVLPRGLWAPLEVKLLQALENISPMTLLRYSRQIDMVVVPALSPTAFRRLSSHIVSELPQALANMPNTLGAVRALARAVHLSQIINVAAIERLTAAVTSQDESRK